MKKLAIAVSCALLALGTVTAVSSTTAEATSWGCPPSPC